MKYEAILVLGRGIDQEGNIPETAAAPVRKAVELVINNISNYVIFSGKWSYQSKVSFPITESEAMAKYAESIGLSSDSILIEKDSEATVTNLCNVKQQILEPRGWKKILIIALDPLKDRILENSRLIFGPEYQIDFMDAGYSFSKDQREKLIKDEKRKMIELQEFLKDTKPGDDRAITQLATEEIERRTMKNNKEVK